jgi:hypothetical protein
MTNTPGDGQPPDDAQGAGYSGREAHDRPGGQPYPPAYPQGPVRYAPDHPRATTSLVLGILGVVLCQVVAPFAWAIGKKTLTEIDASQGRVGGRGAAQAGYVLGIVGTALLALSVLALAAYLVFMVALVGGTVVTTP